MPEAVFSKSLPTAGTVPHSDDDTSSPDPIQIPRPYPRECSTVLLLGRMTPVAVFSTVVGYVVEKTAIHSSTGDCSFFVFFPVAHGLF